MISASGFLCNKKAVYSAYIGYGVNNATHKPRVTVEVPDGISVYGFSVCVFLGTIESVVRLDRRVCGRAVEGSGSGNLPVTCAPRVTGRIAGRIVGIPGNPGILGQSRDIGPTFYVFANSSSSRSMNNIVQ